MSHTTLKSLDEKIEDVFQMGPEEAMSDEMLLRHTKDRGTERVVADMRRRTWLGADGHLYRVTVERAIDAVEFP